jgi:hypothetical protein
MNFTKNWLEHGGEYENLPFLSKVQLFELCIPESNIDDSIREYIANRELINWKIIDGVYYHRLFPYYHSKVHAKLKNPSGIKMYNGEWVYCDEETQMKIAEYFDVKIQNKVEKPEKGYPFEVYFRIVKKRDGTEVKRFLMHGMRGDGKGQSVKPMSPSQRLACLNDFLSRVTNLKKIPREDFKIFGGQWPIGQEYKIMKEMMSDDTFFIKLEQFSLNHLNT